MKDKWKLLMALLLGTVLCLQFFSCKKYDPGIFEGKYVGTFTNSSDDTAGNIIRADTVIATKASNKEIEFSNRWFSVSGKAVGNQAEVSQNSSAGNVTGQVDLNGTMLTITGVDVIAGNKINYSFVGSKQ